MPLVNLRSTQLLKILRDSGSRIYCTPDQADQLAGIAPLLVVSETQKPTVETAKTYAGLEDLLVQLSGKDDAATENGAEKKQTVKSEDAKAAESLLAELDEAEQDVEEDDNDAKGEKDKATMRATIQLLGKFVDLADLLPPLPHKGNFNVESIKDSQYFFS